MDYFFVIVKKIIFFRKNDLGGFLLSLYGKGMITDLSSKIPKFNCEYCNLITDNKKDFKKHELTRKHIKNIKWYKNGKNFPNLSQELKQYSCSYCGKYYTHASGLCRHKKTCQSKIEEEQEQEEDLIQCHENMETYQKIEIYENPEKENIVISIEDPSANQIEHLASVVIDLMKQNQEFKDLIIVQNKQMMEMVKEGKVINNHNNTTNNFNLSVFLNETCKDAMNIKDFVASLQMHLPELEDVGKLGYVEGISRIFLRGLNELDVCKRPIHCSDLKREIVYVKDQDAWEKDQEKGHMVLAVKQISRKNMLNTREWVKKNPEYMDYNSKKYDQYNQIMVEATGGSTKEENIKYYNKIIRLVAKEMVIEKDKYITSNK